MKRLYIKTTCIIIMAFVFHVRVYAHEKDNKPSGTQQKNSSTATTEWHIDGSVKVTGTKTFTISNVKLDYKSLFEKNADLTGGILGTIYNDDGTSKMELSVYPYTGQNTSTTDDDRVYYYVSTTDPYGFTISGGDGYTDIEDKRFYFNSTDIKRNAQKKNIYIPSLDCQTKYGAWLQYVGNYFSRNSLNKKKCSDAYWYVTIVAKITDAYITRIKIPGLGEYTPLALFTNDAPTKIVEAYVDGTLQHSYSNATDAATNTLSATVGQTITFTAWASGTDADQTNLTVSGFPGTWLARFAGEAMYWCTPSITPGDFRPFLGFDAQIHGTALRRYPDNFITNENSWIYDDRTYSWSYIVQREMDTAKTTYTPQAVWNKQHTVGSVTQRRNQREGVNMQLLYSWGYDTSDNKGRWNRKYTKNSYVEDPDDASYFTEGTDDDELLYLTNGSDGKTPTKVFYSTTSSDWKEIQDGETDCSLCDMVTAYKQQQYYLNGVNNNSAYSGHEIEDDGCVKETDSTGDVKVTDDYIISANYNFPAGSEYDTSAPSTNNKEPGNVSVFGLGIPLGTTTPVSVNYGFYGMIEGTQYPSVGEDATYKIRGLDPDKIDDYYIVYDFEDEMGNLYSYKLSTSSTTVSNDAYSGKTAYLTNTNMEDDGSESITVEVPILGNGYNTITVYYKDPYSSEAAIIGGKELMEVQLRFISAYGTNKSFTGSAATDGSNINEGKGDGAYIYIEETRDNIDYPGSATDWTTNILDGWPDPSFVRSYVIPTNQNITFGALDADPFTLTAYETEWYMSSRNIAKRISDDSLSEKQFLKWKVYEFSNSYAGISENSIILDSGYGKSFTYSFNHTGTYCIKAIYRGLSSVSHIIKVVNYSTVTDPQDKSVQTQKGDIKIRDITSQELSWLKEFDSQTDFSQYKLAYVTDILSSYKYSDGYRAYKNDSLKNRFSYFNDYANQYLWSVKYSKDSSNDNLYYTFNGNNYSDTSWFPNIWIRHNSEKAWVYSGSYITDPTSLTDLSEASYDTSSSSIIFSTFDMFKGSYANQYEPWQERLPWIAMTKYYGSRIRSNIKALYKLSKMFDENSGAFSGSRADFTTSEVYAAYEENPNFKDMTDEEKDKQKFYYDLYYKRKRLFNPSKVKSLSVYNPDPNSTSSNKIFIATTDLTTTDISSDDDSTFIKGVDLSTVNNLKDAKVKYTEDNSAKYDIMTMLKDYGANLVRLRLWVNPVYTSTTSHATKGDDYSYNNYDDVLKAIKRANNRGLKVLLDLHLTDNWADPSSQIVPSVWKDDVGDFSTNSPVASIDKINNLYTDVYNYVYGILDSLRDSGNVIPAYIQIGNETNTDILVTENYSDRVAANGGQGFEINWDRQADLLKAGLNAVKDFNTENSTSIKTVLHTTGIQDLEYFARKYNEQSLDYDILAVSYYPCVSPYSLENVADYIDTIYSKYGKQILLAETGFPRTYGDAYDSTNSGDEVKNLITSSEYGWGPLTTNYIIQRDWLLQMKSMLKARIATDTSGNTVREALGFVYWEPAWVANSSSYTIEGQAGSPWDNMTFFEPDYSNSTPTYTLETNGGIQVFCNDLFCYNPTYSSSSSDSSTAKTIPGTIVPDSGYNNPADTKQLLFIYPNPATDELHVRINNDDGTYEARVYDMNGRLMLTEHLTQNSILSLSGFTNGIYLLQVHGSAFSETAKIVIHK